MKLPREVREEISPPTAAQFEAALAFVAPRYRLPLLVLEGTGLRVGELVALEWGDLDEREGRLRVRRSASKSARSRFSALPGDLADRITALCPGRTATPGP